MQQLHSPTSVCVFIGGVCQRCRRATNNSSSVRVCVPPAPARGPGTELKKLLARVRIVAAPDCSCNARAAEMDRQGVDWCESNVDTIVGWLREQAAARGLPFVDLAGRMLVRLAVKNARRANVDR